MSRLFFLRPFVYEMWAKTYRQLGVAGVYQSNLIQHFLGHVSCLHGKRSKRVKHLAWLAVVSCVWSCRNNIIFKRVVPNCNSLSPF